MSRRIEHLDSSQLVNGSAQVDQDDNTPAVDVKVFDWAAIVQMLSPKLVQTYEGYVDNIFLPYITRQFETASWMDTVWDKTEAWFSSATMGCVISSTSRELARLSLSWREKNRVFFPVLGHA